MEGSGLVVQINESLFQNTKKYYEKLHFGDRKPEENSDKDEKSSDEDNAINDRNNRQRIQGNCWFIF